MLLYTYTMCLLIRSESFLPERTKRHFLAFYSGNRNIVTWERTHPACQETVVSI
jgi:hypothetical protein